ncbi:hypothetical protein M426DRAFT_14014 [Hypoxylon sp. CI-4A]|nr:hypothetical protein M426DRAFT_14014 [Hypoxylon sp. CI-4A]
MHHQLLAKTILLAGALTRVHAAPSPLQPRNSSASPKCWYGSDFPPESSWLSFDALFSKWHPQFQSQGDTPAELARGVAGGPAVCKSDCEYSAWWGSGEVG